jgi:hypothetical protein
MTSALIVIWPFARQIDLSAGADVWHASIASALRRGRADRIRAIRNMTEQAPAAIAGFPVRHELGNPPRSLIHETSPDMPS